jgi:hypothetical protein
VAFAVLGAATALNAADAGPIDFNQDVRPLLSNNCFYCHGPDDKHREADLRLDTFEGATAERGGYAAIVPGKPDESALLERVISHDDDVVMPPPASKKPPLSAADVAILQQWIREGAKYQPHWAFLPLKGKAEGRSQKSEGSTQRSQISNLKSQIRNPIDAFIAQKLARQNLTMSPEADRATLIRRVSLDITGLLPTIDEVQAFERDQDPLAYEKLVDRLLASPHYGERWGRHWLDQARYADSNGYSVDSPRQMWPYRDWVISALNQDMPFDQFTIEQLAGDLLPNPTKSQLAATAFHRNTLINQEGGTDAEQFRVEAMMDRVNTTGAVWLGLTVGCAQCHSHKFDPISHIEYYRLYAFFNSSTDVNNSGKTLPIAPGELLNPSPDAGPSPPPISPQELAQLRAKWESAELARLEAQSTSQSDHTATWQPAKYVAYSTESNAQLQRLDDNSLLADGQVSSNDTYRVQVTTDLKQVAAIRLRVLTHDGLPKRGPGLAANGNFVLTDFQVLLAGKSVAISQVWADHQQPDYPIAAAIDPNPQSGWAINVGPNSTSTMNADHEATFVFAEPLEPADQPLEVRLFHQLNKQYLIGRFAVEVTDRAPIPPQDQSQAMLQALQTSPEQRNQSQQEILQAAFEVAEPLARASAFKAEQGSVALMIMEDLPKRRDTYLLTRGDFTRPDKELGKLNPGVLESVSPPLPAGENHTRLDLARWLVDPQNPLTPRVTINRIWMRYFGRGLVETEEDFGTQGSAPTHPELLDWLSQEFIRRGWSQKQIHRLIVTSAAYRQASQVRGDLAKHDPRNLLLGRQERLRLEAEIVRDAALCASGLLDRTMGGPSVHPPQPAGVYSFTQDSKQWKADVGANRYRRGLYTFFYRSAPYPLFTTFDAPNFQTVCTRRPRSNTPLQSLTLANDVAFLEMAQSLALRLAREVPGNGDAALAARLDRACLLCLSRGATPREKNLLIDYYRQSLADFGTNEADAKKLTTPELVALLPPQEAAALVCVARAILNTDNFITRE